MRRKVSVLDISWTLKRREWINWRKTEELRPWPNHPYLPEYTTPFTKDIWQECISATLLSSGWLLFAHLVYFLGKHGYYLFQNTIFLIPVNPFPHLNHEGSGYSISFAIRNTVIQRKLLSSIDISFLTCKMEDTYSKRF